MGDASGGGDDTWVDIPADRCLIRYAFENEHEAHIRHGKIEIDGILVEKSFLCFKTKGGAEDVRENLSQLKGDSFLKSCLIISHKKYYWLAVDRFDYSLERYCDINPERWEWSEDTRCQLKPTYQQIVRDIITGICQLHSQKYWHGDLSITNILIVNGRAKFAFLSNGASQSSTQFKKSVDRERKEEFKKLQKVFKDVLGIVNSGVELNHFHKCAALINNWRSLAKLFFHPLLMTPMQRFHLPITMHTLVPYQLRWGQWRENYTIQGAKWKDNVRGGYKEILNYRKNNTQGENNTQDKLEYKDDAWGQFTFVRNTIVHINHPQGKEVENATSSRGSNGPKKTAEEVEQELSVMLPSSFTNVYDLFKVEALASTSVHFREEKIQF